jgi:hypothetical protein
LGPKVRSGTLTAIIIADKCTTTHDLLIFND